jgi:hypothetical protein
MSLSTNMLLLSSFSTSTGFLTNDSALSLDKLLSGTVASNLIAPAKTTVSTENNKTLEAYHQQEIEKFNKQKKELPELKKRLKKLKKELNELNKTNSVFVEFSQVKRKEEVEKEIKKLEEKISGIKSGSDEADYFLRVGDILFSYADASERIAKGEVAKESTKKTKVPVNSISLFFEKEETDEVVKEENVISHIAEPENNKKSVLDISNDIGFRRDKALDMYLNALDPDSVSYTSVLAATIEENFGNCPYCDIEMKVCQNEATLSCSECGFQEYILVDSEKPSYKDPPREMAYCAYKKVNHLNEWLAQFQAKETTDIGNDVLELIRNELKKERITDMSKVKASKLKEVIRKLKLTKCYDHVAHILNRLNGISAPVLSREIEDKLRFMFKEIQFSFVKHCPPGRSNFLSYSYVLYKFCELLELDEYLPCFPLLKSREKLWLCDQIWKKITAELMWAFIPTV